METGRRPELKHWEAESFAVPRIDKDTRSYFMTVCKRFEEDFEDEEDKALFMENVSVQTLEKEVALSCDDSASGCMQVLLIRTRDGSVLVRFMASFLDHLLLMCTHPVGTYVMQTLLEAALRFLQHPSDYATTNEEDENVEKSDEEQQKSYDGNFHDSSHMSTLPSYRDKVSYFWVVGALPSL